MIYRFRTQITMTDGEFDESMKETNMDSSPFIVMFIEKYGNNSKSLASNSFRVGIDEVNIALKNSGFLQKNYTELFKKYSRRIGE